jgi:hypothetical protein
MLQRSGTVDAFNKRFITLSCRDTPLTKAQQIQLFITGLGDPLCTDVALQQPSTLDDAMIFARVYKQRNTSHDIAQPSPTRNYSRQVVKAATPTLTLPSPGVTGDTIPTTVLHLTPIEIAQQRKDIKCFHCNNLFVQGQKKQYKQLFVIEVPVEEGDDEQPPDGNGPTISLHALTGIQPRSGRTMQIYVFINDTKLQALLDSGSTHNFVDSEAASRAWIECAALGNLRVVVANGNHITSSGCCNNLKISIAEEDFFIDYYNLALGSYEMILGV